ncbi:sirohydrochlorin chelatase [Gordonia sp. CPCC 205333]|uniref:sirohydrochlorin chelatase n=1 Tax=Gordonia sp. CPCC 205333 TaxID=3140790 RepID=UPI003AF39AB5
MSSAVAPPALLLVAHGSRDERFAATAEQVRAAVAGRLPGAPVELSYLDLNAPLVGDVLTDIGTRGDDVVVVPLLFGDGYHSRFDLPAIISAARRQQVSLRANQTPVIGDTTLVPALAARLSEAGLSADDGVLMCAVGSSDAGSDAQARCRATELSAYLQLSVEVVFATKLGESDVELHSAIARLESAGAGRIVFSPYFLSAGLLTERVVGKLVHCRPDSLIAAPVGDHPALIDAVTSRYRSAIQESASSHARRDAVLHALQYR